MGTAWTYDKDIHEEHVAIRTKAGLMDVSGLKKLHLVGPHSHAVLHHATSRDVTKIYPGKAAYATMLDDRGLFIDDCILYRTGPNSWMVVHGSGAGHEQITRSAMGRNVAVLFDDDLHDLSLQGPLAVDFLAEHVPGIRDLPYFHHVATRLFDRPVTISRTGYTGERGYEIFCKADDAPVLWDTILEKGAELGIIPCRFTVLDMLRVESYLLFFPTTTPRCTPSRTTCRATRCGSWAWTSRSARARPASAGPRCTTSSRARSASRSSACWSRATRRPRRATCSTPTASGSA
jgi:aminomethyltransferase